LRVLVDSTVWIDFLRGASTSQVERLVALIVAREDLCICGFVFTEVLQGIRNEKEFVSTKALLGRLVYLDTDRSTFELGATIFRSLRAQGITIRNSIDCLIAATVVQHQVALLEADRDLVFIDSHYPLNLIGR
jgi:predicted nucleic acid-binding protein